MTVHTDEIPIDLSCHLCGYDLRAHPLDGTCPECGASVAESQRVAAVPRRPAWRDSDPRWRRRMLAGTWVLVFLPLMSALNAFGWTSSVPVPNVFGYGAVRTLDETFLCYPDVYPPLVFCIGVVLLFSKERGRRRSRLDRARGWGILCSYVVMLLSAIGVLFISALVLVGIAALFQYMPLKYQPKVTPFFVEVSAGYLRYGPQPTVITEVVLVAFSSVVILLACVPLFGALCSTVSKRLSAILVAPLVLFALMHLAQAGRSCLSFPAVNAGALYPYSVYFCPGLLTGVPSLNVPWFMVVVEAIKWCIVVGIAASLSIAQFAAWRHGKKTSARDSFARGFHRTRIAVWPDSDFEKRIT